ncbi:Hypothetical predicted protein, partial [Paramuricea clavata]
MNVEDKKQERSKAKMAVTVAARRLIGAYNRDCEYDILKDSMFELEKVFDDFCVINEEYELIVSDEKYAEHRVVNGEDIMTYRDNVKRCYEEARSVFVSVKTTIEQKARRQSAGPVKVALKNDICRIHELITVVDESFKLENVNMAALQLDKNDLQSILNIICDNMAKLGSIETQEQVNLIQEDVDAIIRAVYNCIRKINLFLHEQQAFVKSLHIETATLPSETNTPPENINTVSPPEINTNIPPEDTETINTMSPPGNQHQHPPENTETINTMSPPGNQHQHPPENTETINTMSPPGNQHQHTPENTETINTMSPPGNQHQHPPETINTNTPPDINTNTPPEDTDTINTMSPPETNTPPETISTTSPSVINTNIPPEPIYTATHPEIIDTPAIETNTIPPMLPINAPPINYSSPFGTQVTTNITKANTPLPTLPGTSTGFCLNTSAQTFIPSTTFHSESSSTSGQTHLSQQCQNPTNLSTGFPPFAMPIGSNLPRMASSYYSNHNQSRSNLSTSPMYTTPSGHQPTVPLINTRPSHQDSTIRLKRMALPTFSGLRKDWPEFKAVWKSMAESASYNKTALAHELKNSVKGEAKHRIKSVFVTKPEAYDIMWEKLECHYGDTTASVQAALEDLQRLKPVKEEDYKALVELVDEVESAYSQLEELNQLNTLTMRDVDNLTDLLPTHLKVNWRRKYRDLSSAEKLQPFTPLMKFLDRERSVVARLAENQHSKKRGNDNARGYSKTFHVERGAKHGQRTYYKCAFPTHRKDTINHTTEQCKEFQKLSISGKDGRYELLKQ